MQIARLFEVKFFPPVFFLKKKRKKKNALNSLEFALSFVSSYNSHPLKKQIFFRRCCNNVSFQQCFNFSFFQKKRKERYTNESWDPHNFGFVVIGTHRESIQIFPAWKQKSHSQVTAFVLKQTNMTKKCTFEFFGHGSWRGVPSYLVAQVQTLSQVKHPRQIAFWARPHFSRSTGTPKNIQKRNFNFQRIHQKGGASDWLCTVTKASKRWKTNIAYSEGTFFSWHFLVGLLQKDFPPPSGTYSFPLPLREQGEARISGLMETPHQATLELNGKRW